MGQGRPAVLVEAKGSTTAAADRRHFNDTFFPALPAPSFEQIFPQGNPQFHNTCSSSGLSGSCAAALWSGESTLDIEWAYSIAPLAHSVLMAARPAQTPPARGFPNMIPAISRQLHAPPPAPA